MDEGDRGDVGAELAARRRELERIAYGRDSDSGARNEALARLAELDERAAAAQRKLDHEQVGRARPDADSLADEASVAEVPSSAPDPEHVGAPRPWWRTNLRIVIGGIAALAALILTVTIVGPGQQMLSGQPAGAFDRDQTAEDRDIPDWLQSSFSFAEATTGQEGLADRLLESVRREEGSNGLVGYLFRDRVTDTYCLAGEQGFDCTGPSQYDLNGLLVTLIDPRNPAEHALRFEMSAEEGFSARILQLDSPATVETMDQHRWPRLISRCLDSRGFDAAANSEGGLVPGPVSEERKLELAMAILHCKSRFPLYGEYLTVNRR